MDLLNEKIGNSILELYHFRLMILTCRSGLWYDYIKYDNWFIRFYCCVNSCLLDSIKASIEWSDLALFIVFVWLIKYFYDKDLLLVDWTLVGFCYFLLLMRLMKFLF